MTRRMQQREEEAVGDRAVALSGSNGPSAWLRRTRARTTARTHTHAGSRASTLLGLDRAAVPCEGLCPVVVARSVTLSLVRAKHLDHIDVYTLGPCLAPDDPALLDNCEAGGRDQVQKHLCDRCL